MVFRGVAGILCGPLEVMAGTLTVTWGEGKRVLGLGNNIAYGGKGLLEVM